MSKPHPSACRKRSADASKPCSVPMPAELQQAIILRARREDRSFSAVVRRALADSQALADAVIDRALVDPVFRLRFLREVGLIDDASPRADVARVLGVSPDHLARIERRAVTTLRHRLQPHIDTP